MSSSDCVIPAPPLLPPSLNSASKSFLGSPHFTRKVSSECKWAIQYPDLQKACILAHVCTSGRPKHYRIKLSIRSIIQEGPTCGLAALAMVTAADAPTVADIFQLTKERAYTNHGEMFQQLATSGRHRFQDNRKGLCNARIVSRRDGQRRSTDSLNKWSLHYGCVSFTNIEMFVIHLNMCR